LHTKTLSVPEELPGEFWAQSKKKKSKKDQRTLDSSEDIKKKLRENLIDTAAKSLI
jgi:hypothetical protein